MSRSSTKAQASAAPITLKVLLQQRHLQSHRAFCREYDKIAEKFDKDLKGSWPSKAQFYRWLSGDLVGLPYPDHCRILERMFPGWTAGQLFDVHTGTTEFIPDPSTAKASVKPASQAAPKSDHDQVVSFYPHRSDTPKELWMNLLVNAQENIDLFANASLFLPEENPEAIETLKKKARGGTKIRILMGDPDHDAMKLRGHEERLYEAIPARIRMALAYYRPLVDIDGIEFRLHGTSLYNSIFRYDDQMLVNQHIYGTYGYMAPVLHLRQIEGADLFETYLKSFELIWNEEAYEMQTKQSASAN